MNEKLPRWNLKSIYPSFDSPAYKADKELLQACIDDFQKKLVRSEKKVLTEKLLLDLIRSFEISGDTAENLSAYTEIIYTTNTQDKRALVEINEIDRIKLPLGIYAARFGSLLVKNKTLLKGLVKKSSELKPYKFFLEKSLEKAKHQMDSEMEYLGSDLARSGADAWARLHSSIVSTSSVLWDETTGERKTLTALRDCAHNKNREIRERAYRMELAALKNVEIPLAAALNGVKGQAITLDKRRGWKSVFEKSSFQSCISEKTLNVLIAALEKSLPVFRRYLKAKAKILGLEKCAFYDLFAPVSARTGSSANEDGTTGTEIKKWTWKESGDFIAARFEEFDPSMARFARNLFLHSWVDAEGREGKIGGAYCADFPLAKESRILCNFEGSFDSVTTLAHEIGHAWHHELVKDLPRSLALYPMTLAETASIFAETLVFEGALKKADGNEIITLIESNLKDSCQVIVDILSRFYFERELFKRREKGELAPDDLCSIMLDAQKKCYGAGLDNKEAHPYMWAVKDHYYNYVLSFYNYPYAFGQLFSLALYARALNEGPSFAAVYRDLLSSTGRLSAEYLARKAGFDIEDENFWQSGIKIINARVKRFEELQAAALSHTPDIPCAP
ncbi:MAG: M3 family oligoendopeptidase [Spirochaetaceae bacterium]|jgi:pepF/M3 family oligoendopeptidase|nr:M3 family oligoendopeptidase [Spirochaetaceae bacterium]